MRFKIKSIFDQIAQQVFQMRDVKQAKQFIVEFISSKDIKDEDKTKILSQVNKCSSMISLQQYICNSLLQYEGMGVKLK